MVIFSSTCVKTPSVNLTATAQETKLLLLQTTGLNHCFSDSMYAKWLSNQSPDNDWHDWEKDQMYWILPVVQFFELGSYVSQHQSLAVE
jgi:hypothetical protein